MNEVMKARLVVAADAIDNRLALSPIPRRHRAAGGGGAGDGEPIQAIVAGYVSIIAWRHNGWVYANGHAIAFMRPDEHPTAWRTLPTPPSGEPT